MVKAIFSNAFQGKNNKDALRESFLLLGLLVSLVITAVSGAEGFYRLGGLPA
ncbi:MAG: hypothetical protein LBR98_04475 [Syntrophomonadaceae bacterium]|nr:hypothetical protein [Syntrophomonadaceae bacterium]